MEPRLTQRLISKGIFLLLCLCTGADAFALQTSPNALRIEDSKSGNVVLGADQAVVERGEIYKNILVLWGHLEVRGQVEEVVLLSGSVKFFPGSKLTKKLLVIGGNFEIAPDTDFSGEKVVFEAPGPFWSLLQSAGNVWRAHYEGTARALSYLGGTLLAWIFGFLLFYLFPGLQRSTEGKLWAEWPRNLLAALFGMLASPVVFALLIISILGIVMIPLYFLFLVAAFAISYAAAALWTGHRILPPKRGKKFSPLSYLLGIVVLQLLWYSGTFVGVILVLFLWTLGWGTLVRGIKSLF